jgi:uncharacterized protein YeeX (DUF496 family)
LVTQYLIESFESLINFSAVQAGNKSGSIIIAKEFNNAATMIQLLGSARQIELTVEILEPMSQRKVDLKKLEELLHNLRDNLRAELNLEEVNEKINVARLAYTCEVDHRLQF